MPLLENFLVFFFFKIFHFFHQNFFHQLCVSVSGWDSLGGRKWDSIFFYKTFEYLIDAFAIYLV